MEETILNGVIHYTKNFFNINQQLLDWDLSPVEGKGLFVGGHEDYGHIQIKIYESSDSQNKLIWNLPSEQLPDEYGAKTGARQALDFFISYLEGIRGKRTTLIFEINDGSYHPVDSKHRAYVIATIYALVNCFSKT